MSNGQVRPFSSFSGKIALQVSRFFTATAPAALVLALLIICPAAAQEEKKPPKYPGFPSEMPEKFEPVKNSFDYVRREEMIPMRDGVKLHTVILTPRGAHDVPILLTRTPYNADRYAGQAQSPHLARVIDGGDNVTEIIIGGGYIRVLQDIRGKYNSEGDYVMNRPLRGSQNPTPVDHATDTWDTIDWLVKNVTETNGRVGIIGTSYNGFLSLMPLADPHPALKVAVPINPMVDGWIGDDWFHNGAFRQTGIPYIYSQQATRSNDEKWWEGHFDEYDVYLAAGSAGELARRRGMEQLGFWRKLLEHPAYDAYWREQAVDKVLAACPLKVPVMLIHGLWDQEDIYGAVAVYRALEPKDTGNDSVFLVMGPWNHGQASDEAVSLGVLDFHLDTARYFRNHVLRPFLDQHLTDGAPRADTPPVFAWESGSGRWQKLQAWPPAGDEVHPAPLYLHGGGAVSFTPPLNGEASFGEYISDPARPVTYRQRPIAPGWFDNGKGWENWLVEDQRWASSRTDVLSYVSDVLAEPLKISGNPQVNLVASTSGTDSDWVVKLIDVYPDEYAGKPQMGGFQLMVSADIFRGRYRESLEFPKALEPDKPLTYKFALPAANHMFLPGHRIMVQVQSSWFPLYDRNPQTFVPSIFEAKPADYRKAVQRVYHTDGQASFIELPLNESK